MVLSVGSKWGWRRARQAPSGLSIQSIPRKNMMEIAEVDEQMIRCDDEMMRPPTFSFPLENETVSLCLVKTTTICFTVMKSNRQNCSWSQRKGVRRPGLIQGQLIMCYLLLNHPGNWRDGLFASRWDWRVWKAKSSSAAGLQRSTFHHHFSSSFVSATLQIMDVQYVKAWVIIQTTTILGQKCKSKWKQSNVPED